MRMLSTVWRTIRIAQQDHKTRSQALQGKFPLAITETCNRCLKTDAQEWWRADPYATRIKAFDDAADRGRQDHCHAISVFYIYLADKLRRKTGPAALCLSRLSTCHVDACVGVCDTPLLLILQQCFIEPGEIRAQKGIHSSCYAERSNAMDWWQ
jgi:hypothetical protein